MNKKKPWPPLASIVPFALMIMGGISFLINLVSLPLIFLKLKKKNKPKAKK